MSRSIHETLRKSTRHMSKNEIDDFFDFKQPEHGASQIRKKKVVKETEHSKRGARRKRL